MYPACYYSSLFQSTLYINTMKRQKDVQKQHVYCEHLKKNIFVDVKYIMILKQCTSSLCIEGTDSYL